VDFRPLYSAAIHHSHRRLAEEIKKTTPDAAGDAQLTGICETLHKYSMGRLLLRAPAETTHSVGASFPTPPTVSVTLSSSTPTGGARIS